MELVEGKTLGRLLPKDGFPLSRLLEIAIPLVDARQLRPPCRDYPPGPQTGQRHDRRQRAGCVCWTSAWPKLNQPTGPVEEMPTATLTLATAQGQVVGTFPYMSPEQAEGRDVRSAFGRFFPWNDPLRRWLREYDRSAVIHRSRPIGAILRDEQESITDLKPSLPRHAGRHHPPLALAKKPDRRYQTAIDLRNELEELRDEIDSRHLHFRRPPGIGPRSALESRALGSHRSGPGPSCSRLCSVAVGPKRTGGNPLHFGPAHLHDRPGLRTELVPRGRVHRLRAYARRQCRSDGARPVAGGDATVRAGGPGDETSFHAGRRTDGFLAYVSTTEPGAWVYLVPPHGGNTTQS